MDVLLANEITPAMLVSTNAPERLLDQVEWSNQAWPAGSAVTRTQTRRVYRAAYDVPAGGAPPDENIATAKLPYWIDIGPMNQWALFDGRVGTQTVGPVGDDLQIVLQPGVITNIWIGNISLVNSVEITVRNKPGGVIVYEAQSSLARPVTTYWDWWFSPINLATDVMFSGLPAYRNCEITLTFRTVSPARIGMAAFGKTENLGKTLWDPETNHRNYSARQLDQQWGPSEGTGGVVTRDQSYTVVVDPDEAPRVSRFMEKAMRLPAVYLPHGHPKFEGIRGFGQAVDARMRYPSPGIVQLSMTIRGFI